MSADKSYLSEAKYGYDIVVAMTQASINATMKKYLYGFGNQVHYIIVIDDPNTKSATMLISYEDFLKKSKGSDPFSIPDGTDRRDSQDLANVDDAGFVAGIKFTLGLPTNFDADKFASMPDIVDLRDGVDAISYRLMCADIQIAQLNYGRRGTTWSLISQNSKPNRAWTCTSRINLKLDRTEFDSLPEDVQHRIGNLDDNMFSIQQLLVDLDTAALADVPQWDPQLPSDSEAMSVLNKYFNGKYFGAMKDAKRPVLGYTVVEKAQTATLKPTALNFYVSPLVAKNADPNLKTLDYLCSTQTAQKPAGVPFTWDWVNAEDAKQTHGVIAINRNTFTDYLEARIFEQAKAQCFKPWVRNWVDGMYVYYQVKADHAALDLSKFKVEKPGVNADNTIFTIHYEDTAYDRAGLEGALGALELRNTYNCTVRAEGNKIHADSDYTVHLFVRGLQNRNEADVFRKIYKDVYELSVDAQGRMQTLRTPNEKDESATDSTNAFANLFANVNDVFNSLSAIKYEGNHFEGAQIKELDKFIFPGGSTFAFKGFHFSENGDLLCAITYADPE